MPANDEALDATTLAAQFADETGHHVHVIADSAANAGIFAGSRNADVFWMDNGGQFAARGEAPDWLAEFNMRNSPENLHGAKWMALGAKPDALALRTR